MATPQSVWGIDVGRCALKAVRLRAGAEGKVELLAFEHIEHAKILTQPDADRAELIGAALEKFLAQHDITKDQVVIGVPGQHTLARFTKLPPVKPNKIPDIVRYEADQQIPFDMDEVIWDYQTFQREDFPDVEVGIFAMKRELIREHLLYFEQAAIEPVCVQSGPLADYNAALYDGWLGEDHTALINIGAENTDLIICTPDTLWTRTIAIGGNNFTEALVKFFKLSFARAESLKRSAATSKYGRQIFQAMRPIFADLVQELQRSIGFYLSTHRDAEINKVVGLGNAFTLPGLEKYLQQNLGLDVERPKSFSKLVTANAPNAQAFDEQLLAYTVAYGLAVQGLDLAKVQTNLLPIEMAKQVVWRKKRPTFAAAAACLVLAGGLIWFRQYTDIKALAQTTGSPGVRSLEDAASIIDNGADRSLPPRAQAQQILEAGQLLQRELSQLQPQGQDEQDQALALVKIEENKVVVPRIIDVLHKSVPLGDPRWAEANTPAERRAALAAMGIPREERTYVEIVAIRRMQYTTDVHFDAEWRLNLTGSTDEVYAFAEDAPKLPGIIVEVTCRTPNKKGSTFLNETFMETLRQNGRVPGLGFFINRVHLLEARHAEPDTGRKATAQGGYGGLGRGAAFAAPETSVDEDEASLDIITYEPIEDDWEFDVQFDVILGEEYPQPEADEEGDLEPAPEP